jgi:(p)ppGpp synthase/HD superfamily hydrolase
MSDISKIALYAEKCYKDANCEYGVGESYMTHIDMVVGYVNFYKDIFSRPMDVEVMIGAAYCHDLMEDAKQTYNNISSVAGKKVADVVLAVTDVPAENRLMKHLLTMGKTVKDYRAIILKMCDILANATYSMASGSSMHAKYVEEYQYRKPIFQKALAWYKGDLDQEVLQQLWNSLDDAHRVY